MAARNRAAVALLLATIVLAPGAMAQIENQTVKKPTPWQLSLTANLGTWSAKNIDNSGTQNQVLSQIVYSAENWGAGATARAAQNNYHTTQSENQVSFSTMTDTVASAYYLLKKGEYNIRLGLDLGAPTGKPDYTNKELKAIITDPVNQDLMILNQFGAGRNIAPNIAVSRKYGKKLTTGLGLRYDYNDKFDISSEEDDELIDPGERIMFMLSGAYEWTSKDYLMLVAFYSRGTEDKRGDKIIFRGGDSTIVEARYIRIWSEAAKTIFSLTYSTQAKNEYTDSSGVLNAELSNSNNNGLEIMVNSFLRRSDFLALTGIVGYKQVLGNDYEKEHTLHDAGRTKFYLEPGAILIYRETLYATVKARYTQVNDNKDIFSPEDAQYDVTNIDLAIVRNF